jgi:NADH dehydrogenase FAD-containing subunit
LKSLQKKKLPHAHITLLTQHAQMFQTRKLAPFVANGLAFEDCLTDLQTLLPAAGVHWSGRQGRAMDAASRTVLLDDGSVLDYDVLSVNIGPQPRREAIE